MIDTVALDAYYVRALIGKWLFRDQTWKVIRHYAAYTKQLNKSNCSDSADNI